MFSKFCISKKGFSMRHQRTGKRVTLQDIARKTGYSLTTVSRALRNMSDIGPEATACIQQTARDRKSVV